MTDERPTDDDIQAQRERLLDIWEEAAQGWGRQADRTQESAMPVSDWMIDHAGLAARADACSSSPRGLGIPGSCAARLIEPGGTLISSDASAGMLEVARERAEEQGVTNVEFKQLQLEWIDMAAASGRRDPVSLGSDADRRSCRGVARVPAGAQTRRPAGPRRLGSE